MSFNTTYQLKLYTYQLGSYSKTICLLKKDCLIGGI